MNDTFIKQFCYENTTDKSNESIHLELSTPTYIYDHISMGPWYQYINISMSQCTNSKTNTNQLTTLFPDGTIIYV